MIVRSFPDRLELITQPDHSRLARQVMEHCAALAGHARRNTILHAINEHDSGWTRPDSAPVVIEATGRIADFITAPIALRQAVWPVAIAGIADDPWAAALIAQHALTLYDRFRPDSDWSPFFARIESIRDGLLSETGLPLDDLAADYAFVRLADLISLAFCCGTTDEQLFAGWAVRFAGTRVVVSPDPFGGSEVPVEIDARVLPNRPFRTDADLRQALHEAGTTRLRGDVAAVLP